MTTIVYLMGGNIDSFWDEKQQKRSPNRHSILPDVITKGNFEDLNFVSICLKDGRDIDINDSTNLVHKILNNTEANHIVVGGAEAAADVYDFVQTHTNNVSCLFRCPLQPWNPTTHLDEFASLVAESNNKKSGIFHHRLLHTSQQFRQLIWGGLLIPTLGHK